MCIAVLIVFICENMEIVGFVGWVFGFSNDCIWNLVDFHIYWLHGDLFARSLIKVDVYLFKITENVF